ncbi:unnamed protein product [Plutella xylostella]|uniref:(diamondback moth) hypothetical protein n=1 Tax=Plutella xylostella TaxID=51655 RepID=A0A8S4E1W8_PLUXY|nr:unnamed protein product [Plutella xylostella]
MWHDVGRRCMSHKQRATLKTHAAGMAQHSGHKGPTAAPKATVKRGNSTTTNYLNRKQGMSTSGLMMRKHYMARQERRKRGAAPATRPKPAAKPQAKAASRARAPRSPSAQSSSSSHSSDDEDCAAPSCLRPTGKVDWVQCDGGCEQWFHMHCVGLSRAALREDDDYVCGACAQRSKQQD